ncbi:MAG: L-fucose isomerase [Frankia sp.]|nr:L-fucose isomerase [Frankia sp.]
MTEAGRYRPPWPRVGIRPVVDGRRHGVRESLEERTLAMAAATARLISSNLRYPDGTPVECRVPGHCIGGVAEATAVDEWLADERAAVSISVTPCWCYGAETMDMDPVRPKAVWGFNGTERPGAVYLAAVLAAHNQKGLPAFGVYGRDVQDANDGSIPTDVADKLLRFARAGLAVALLRGRTYLSLGGVSMGIAGSIVDHGFFESYLGMRVQCVDMTELIRRMEQGIYDHEEYGRALAWVRTHCVEGADPNPPEIQRGRAQKDADWQTCVRMTLIARDLMRGNPKLADAGFAEEAAGHDALAAGFQGQRQWTDFLPNGDVTEALLNSSFDWNGVRAPIVFATENDSLNAATMLLGNLLTHTAQVFADVRTFWSPQAMNRVTGRMLPPGHRGELGVIHLTNSGAAALDATGEMRRNGRPAMKPHWEIDDEDVAAALAATRWHPALLGYFRGGGFSSRFVSRGGMPLTMSRISLVAGVGPVLQLAEGWSVDLPAEIHDVLDRRTDPTWPTHWFVPRLTGEGAFADVYSVMANWAANHCAISYGHIGADLVVLAALLRIPVHMHNLPPEQLWRPSMWTTLGTADPEGADFRACALLGPLYR